MSISNRLLGNALAATQHLAHAECISRELNSAKHYNEFEIAIWFHGRPPEEQAWREACLNQMAGEP